MQLSLRDLSSDVDRNIMLHTALISSFSDISANCYAFSYMCGVEHRGSQVQFSNAF